MESSKPFFTTNNTCITAAGQLRLLNAALPLFNDRGIDACSVRELARHSNLSNPALYSHYTSKEELAMDLFERILEVYREKTSHCLKPHIPIQKGLQNVLEQLVPNLSLQGPDCDAFEFLHKFGPRFFPHLKNPCQTPMQVWIDYIAQRQKAGEVRSGNPSIFAPMVIGMMMKLIQFQRIHPDLFHSQDACREFIHSATLMLIKDS